MGKSDELHELRDDIGIDRWSPRVRVLLPDVDGDPSEMVEITVEAPQA